MKNQDKQIGHIMKTIYNVPMKKFDYEAYNTNELAKAQKTWNILKTNKESDLENWKWRNKPNQPASPKDYFEQYQREQLGQTKKKQKKYFLYFYILIIYKID